MSEMKINKNYEVLEGEIVKTDKQEQYNCLMIDMKISYFHQGYPPCRTPGGYEEQISYLKKVFEVNHENELIGKKFIVLTGPCDIFCLYNPQNKQFFSLQAKYFPEQYAQALEEIKKEQNVKYYTELDDFNTLMIGVVKSQKDPKAQSLIFDNLVDSNQLKTKLEEKFPSTFKTKTKKI